MTDDILTGIANKKYKRFVDAMSEEVVVLQTKFPQLSVDECEWIFKRYMGIFYGYFDSDITNPVLYNEEHENV